jgi:hypothetical protein
MVKPVAAFVLFIAVLFVYVIPVRAQSEDDLAQQDVKNRINRIIDTAMGIAHDRAADFNARIATINEARPLELANFDSSHIANNVTRVIDFSNYLAGFRRTDDSLGRALEDSLFILHEEIPQTQDRVTLEAFQDSYATDLKAFDSYVETLGTLYSEVLDVLLFVQQSSYEIHNDQLQFRSQKDVAEYRKLMKPIDATSTALKKASEESRKATALANQKIAEINGGKIPATPASHKTKKP